MSAIARKLCCSAPDDDEERAIEQWRDLAGGAEPPEGDRACRTHNWLDPIDEQASRELLLQATPRDAARLLSASTQESACLYTGIPSSKDGTRLHDAALTCAVGLRLGAEVAAPALCACGAQLDVHGDHALTCRHGTGRHARHSEVNSRIQHALQSAGVAATLEPIGLNLTDGKRPDGCTILPFTRGKEMAWDATVCHTCAPTYIAAASTKARSVAETAEGHKDQKYRPLSDRVLFRAVGLETFGAFGPSAIALFDDIAARIQAHQNTSGTRARLFRQIAAAIQLGNAACILESHSRRH